MCGTLGAAKCWKQRHDKPKCLSCLASPKRPLSRSGQDTSSVLRPTAGQPSDQAASNCRAACGGWAGHREVGRRHRSEGERVSREGEGCSSSAQCDHALHDTRCLSAPPSSPTHTSFPAPRPCLHLRHGDVHKRQGGHTGHARQAGVHPRDCVVAHAPPAEAREAGGHGARRLSGRGAGLHMAHLVGSLQPAATHSSAGCCQRSCHRHAPARREGRAPAVLRVQQPDAGSSVGGRALAAAGAGAGIPPTLRHRLSAGRCLPQRRVYVQPVVGGAADAGRALAGHRQWPAGVHRQVNNLPPRQVGLVAAAVAQQGSRGSFARGKQEQVSLDGLRPRAAKMEAHGSLQHSGSKQSAASTQSVPPQLLSQHQPTLTRGFQAQQPRGCLLPAPPL